MKRCFKCRRLKERIDFYAHPRMADGLLGKCKACTKKDSHARYVAKHDQIRDANKRHRLTPKGRSVRRESVQRYREKYPEKASAHAAVARALASGRLVRQPCEVCRDPSTEAHHPDYSKWLEVRWLCSDHHQQAHRKGPRLAPVARSTERPTPRRV